MRNALDANMTATTAQRPTWGAAHHLALIAIPLIAYQVWTLTAWIASGPTAVNTYRDVASTSYLWAKIFEVALSALGVFICLWVGKACRREGRLTFDALMLIGLAGTVFWDTFVTWFAPIWLYSANWVNLNDWWGHAPFIQNPVAGTTPFPIIFLGVLYPFGCFMTAVLANIPMRWAAKHFDLSKAQLVSIAFAVSIPIWFVIDGAMVLTHLWAGPGMWLRMPVINDLLGDTYYWSGMEFIYCVCWGTFLTCLRYFTDDNGHGYSQQGLAHLSRFWQTSISVLATIGLINLGLIVMETPVMITGFFQRGDYPRYPAHLVSGLCDAPGLKGNTPYGACPGSRNFHAIPLRSTSSTILPICSPDSIKR